MKRICIINFYAYSLFNFNSSAPLGGAELSMYLISQILKKTMKVNLVTGDWGQRSIEKRKGVAIHKSVKLGGNYFIAIIRFWKILGKINADVYLSSGAGPEVAIIAIFCKMKKKRFIYQTASDIDVDKSYIRRSGLVRGLLFEYGLRKADTIVTSVNKHKLLLRKNYPNISAKIEYIPLALPSTIANSADNKRTVLWVSRCVGMKNPGVFLDLAEHFYKEPFVLICPQQSQELELFNRIKKRADNIKNVEFHDFVPFTKILSFFAEAKIFVNTSDYEGFTFTLLQSASMGTPVAYLNVDPDNVITRYQLGLFADGNIEHLISGLQQLLTDQAYWQERSNAITHYLQSYHNYDTVGKKWLALVNNS